ncbi:hypothetical protein HDU67_004882, partial [Dinochytrium kinnereticum]
LPFAVEANLGYVAANVGLDANPLAVFELPQGVRVSPGTGGETSLKVDTSLMLNDNEGTRDGVAGLVDRLMGGRALESRIDLSGLRVGASGGDVLTVFDKVTLPIGLDAAVQILLGTSADRVFDLTKILKDFKPSIGATTAIVKPGKVLTIDTGVEFNLNLPIRVTFKAGHLAAQTGVSGHPLAGFSLPGFEIVTAGETRTALKVQSDVLFNDDDATQTALARVVERFMGGSKLESTVDLSRVEVGVSSSDTLSVLSKVKVALNLDMVVDAVYPRAGPIDAITLLRDFKPSVTGEIGITTMPEQRLGVTAAAALTLPFKLTATLGHLHTQLGLGGHPLAEFTLPGGISVASNDVGVIPVRVDTSLRMTDDDGTRDTVATLVDRFVGNQKLSTSASILGLTIGSSPQDVITAFQKVTIPIDLDSGIALVL